MKIKALISSLAIATTFSSIVAAPAMAEIYIYRGANGERMISDHPQPAHDGNYELLAKRDSLNNAGHILAKRRVDPASVADIRHFIKSASKQYKIDENLVEAVIYVESGFNPDAVSKKGATGLMQLMWPTAQQYEVSDRFDPRENIFAGVKHLRYLMERFNGQTSLVLAAYNAGAGAVDKHRGIPPYPETQAYVKKVLAYRTELKQLYSQQYSD